jgi:SAM-dependent methyltransferase
VSVTEKFDALSRGYSAHDYADPDRYSWRRARLALEVGPALAPGASILDLACGDGNVAEPLIRAGFRYSGVDGSAGMVAEARERLGAGIPLEAADMALYEPREPVDMTLCLRAFFYPPDRRAFFGRVARYTRVKFVFDFDPRVHGRREIEADLRASGLEPVELRAFLLPQRVRVPAWADAALVAIERTGPIGLLALRARGRCFCAAVPARISV